MRVNANERDEITASVAAHAELGSRYDTAVAEGLVERIGDEIDKRIDARLGRAATAGTARRRAATTPAATGARLPGPAAPAPSMPAAAPPPPRCHGGPAG